MGRVLTLVAAALVLFIGGLGLAVYFTRDEDNIEVDNVLSENFSKAVQLAEDPDELQHGRVDLRQLAKFHWDRVLLVAPGVSRARISATLGKPWTGVIGVDSGELLIFRDGSKITRFANYRGTGSFAGFQPLQTISKEDAVFRVHQLVVRLAGSI
jgi:hypothetical protein